MHLRKTLRFNIKKIDIIQYVGKRGIVINSNDSNVTGFSPIKSSKKGDITFLSTTGESGITTINKSKASLIICSKEFLKKTNTVSTIIFVENPRLWFIKILNQFFVDKKIPKGVDSSAIVQSRIGKDVYVPLANYYIENRDKLKIAILQKYPKYVEKILYTSILKMKKASEQKIIDYVVLKCKV